MSVSKTVGYTVVNSIAHPLLSLAFGSTIDAFFPVNSGEELVTTALMFAGQSIVKGLAISSLLGFHIGEDGIFNDPTGGVFIIAVSFYAARNYRARINRLSQFTEDKLNEIVFGKVTTPNVSDS